jgi:hypothetical protein
MSEAVMPDGAVCRPNISPAGVRKRIRVGAVSAALTVAVSVSMTIARVRWYWCLVVFVPAALAAVGFLQAGRRTCVARAAEGTFEHDDFSKTPAPEDDVLRSREVATRINRDSILIGLAAVVLTILATRR